MQKKHGDEENISLKKVYLCQRVMDPFYRLRPTKQSMTGIDTAHARYTGLPQV